MYVITPTLVIWVNGGPLKYQRSLISIGGKLRTSRNLSRLVTVRSVNILGGREGGTETGTPNVFIYRHRGRQRQRCVATVHPVR